MAIVRKCYQGQHSLEVWVLHFWMCSSICPYVRVSLLAFPSCSILMEYSLMDCYYSCFVQGNQSRLFLKRVDHLQQALEQECEDVRLKGLPFVHAFRSFSEVVASCFGVTLKDGYEEKIQKFKESYLSLSISVTPKVIILQLNFKYIFYNFRPT